MLRTDSLHVLDDVLLFLVYLTFFSPYLEHSLFRKMSQQKIASPSQDILRILQLNNK